MKHLRNWIAWVRFWRNLELPLWIGCGGMLLAALAHLTSQGLIFGGVCLAAGLIPRRGLRRTAADLDREFHSANRFETALELSSDHPLREAQERDTLAFRQSMPRRNPFRLLWRQHLAFLFFLGCVVLLIFICHQTGITGQEGIAASPQAEAQKQEEEAEAENNEKEEPFQLAASIEITYPEHDVEFTPIDLLEFEAKAISNAPWERFTAAATRNGEKARRLELEFKPAENGLTFPAGVLALDELDADPFDLVTLRISGVSAGKEILAPPIHIRLKPLREDILIMDCPPGEPRRVVDKLKELISRQIALSKTLTLGRTAFHIDPAMEATPFTELAVAERELGKESSSFAAAERNNPNTLMTAAMIRSIIEASKEMEKAAEKIAFAPPGAERLGQAADHQDRALAHLNRALREVIKVMSREKPEGAPAPPHPHKPKPDEENPGEMLKKALAKQEEVIAGTEPLELPEGLDKPQGIVSWLLRMVSARGELPELVLQESSSAHELSLKCEEAIRSSARNSLRQRSSASAEAIRRAIDFLRENSRKAAQSGFGEARTQLAEAEREAAKQEKQPAGEKAAKKMEQAAETLRKAAEENRSSGDNQQAGRLEETAKKIEEKAKGASSRPGEELAKDLQNLREELGQAADPENGKNPGETAAKLEELARETAYRGKKNEWNDAQTWRNELEQTLEGAGLYWKERPDAPEKRAVHGALMPLHTLLTNFEPEKGFSSGEVQAIIRHLEIIRLALEAEELKKALPTAIYGFQPDRIPEEYREAAAKYFEALSRLQDQSGEKP